MIYFIFFFLKYSKWVRFSIFLFFILFFNTRFHFMRLNFFLSVSDTFNEIIFIVENDKLQNRDRIMLKRKFLYFIKNRSRNRKKSLLIGSKVAMTMNECGEKSNNIIFLIEVKQFQAKIVHF